MNIIKILFAGVAGFFFVSIVLILGLPWLWNWIVTIWNSPLSAGQASSKYLMETLEAFLPWILLAIASILALRILHDSNYNNDNYPPVDLFEGARTYTPTPSIAETQKSPLEVNMATNLTTLQESRGVAKEFDFSKVKQGTAEAASAYKNSQEHKDAQDKLRTLDELIIAARAAQNV